MRNTFMHELVEISKKNNDIYLIAGDVGFSVIEPFKELFPKRYLNAGIAEQNMIGVAAGLAMTGKKVVVYSIIPFVTMRCFEQVRVDLCYQNLPVVLVGVGGGFSYATAAGSHHALEDIAIMRSLPDMTVIAPASQHETKELTPQLFNRKGPSYFRLSNNEELLSYPEHNPIAIGKATELIPSNKYLLIGTGNALDLGWQVCQSLHNEGIDIGLVSMHTIKTLDINYLQKKIASCKGIFTIEEHSIIGGLGEAIAHVVAESNASIIFKAFGVNDVYFHEAGSRKYLNQKAGLHVENICNTILQHITKVSPLSKNLMQSQTL